MINTNDLCKTIWGEFIAIAGNPQKLEPLFFSLYNFGAINVNHTLSLGNEDDFQYLLVREQDYILARSKNMVIHWPHSYINKQNKNTAWKMAKIAAHKELDNIKWEDFLKNSSMANDTYQFGWIPTDTGLLNSEIVQYDSVKINDKIQFDKKGLAKQELET